MPDLLGAIEGGGSKFLCAVGRGPDELEAELRVPTSDPAATLARVAEFFAPHRARLAAVGLCSFGPLDLDVRSPAYGALLATPKPGWAHAPLRTSLAQALGTPVAIETDVNGAALAEREWGSARGLDSVAYVTVGTGVGVGVVLDGRAVHGILHPELGHIRVPRAPGDTFSGVCPAHADCVEGMASAAAIRARAGREPHLLADDDPLWDHVAHALVGLLHTIVLAYAPQRIVLGGGVLERTILGPRLRQGLVHSLAGYVPRAELSPEGVRNYLVAPHFGERAGLAGAFLLAQRAAGQGR
jgi:fructokinase